MNKYIGFTLGILFLISADVSAQNEIDALRYSQFSNGATARSIALGGTGGSFGGDFSSLSINPAGIGVYRNSEVMFTPTLRINNLQSTYLGNKEYDERAKLGVSNYGVVFTKAAKGTNYERSDWKAVSFGLGYNRLADFNYSGNYSGSNSASSLTDIFSADAIASGITQNMVPPFGYLAYESYLLDDNLESIARNNILNNNGSLRQSKDWRSKGGIDEWTISLGGNYKEKLMLGATIGILSYKFDKNSTFKELDETGDLDNDFNDFSYNEYLSTIGYGVNIKLGAIYVINDQFRVGAAVHTPTWNAMNDLSDYSIVSNTENLKFDTGQPSSNPETGVQPDYQYEYNYSMRTPWRGILSATAFLGKNGFITADYEFVDYSSMKYTFDAPDRAYENSVNKSIKNTFTTAHNIRLGVEGRMDNFMGRIGFAYHTSPFQRAADFGGERIDFSAGLGARFGAFFMDLAYMHSMVNTTEYAYPLASSAITAPAADLKYGNNFIALTLGLKF